MDFRTKRGLDAYSKQSSAGKPSPDALDVFKLYGYCFSYSLLKITVDSYSSYLERFEDVKRLMLSEPEWHRELRQMLDRVKRQYADFQVHSEKEGTSLNNYLQEIEQELLTLSNKLSTETDFQHSSLIMEIKEAVHKGNRTNFKMVQELQQKLEELESKLADSEGVKEAAEAAALWSEELIKLLLDTFDLLDLVRVSAYAKEDDRWNKELNLVVEKALNNLREYGLEEIHVLGELFDGEIMEGTSTIPLDELPAGYQRYQVYAVTQRGFRLIGSDRLIRKAKVTTVY